MVESLAAGCSAGAVGGLAAGGAAGAGDCTVVGWDAV